MAERTKPKRIRIRKIKSDAVWGLALHDKREIHLDERMDDKTLLDIASHETLHIELPDMDESAVDRAARSIADVLWRLGFRQEE